MADSFQEDSFVEDSFSEDGETAAPTFIQGMFKTYKGKPKGLRQKADVALAKTTKTGLDVLNAPFEFAGEAIAAPLENRKAVLPTILGGEGATNPFSVVNKLLRATAGAASGIPSGTSLESARSAYHADRGNLGVAEDTAMGLLLGKVAPEVVAAPMDAAIVGTGKILKGAKNLATATGKKAIRVGLGPTEEAQSALMNRPKDMSRQTDFKGLSERVATSVNNLSKKVSELDDAAWNTLPIDEALPKAKVISLLEETKKDFIGKGGVKIGSGDKAAVKQIDDYIERIKGITQETLPADPGMTVAIKLRGKTYTGKPGEIHADLITRMAKDLKEKPDDLIDAINKIGDQGFSEGGKFLTRSEAKALTGERPEAASMLASGKMAKTSPKPVKSDSSKISMPQLKDIIQSIEKDADYGPSGTDSTNRAVKSVRHKIDQYLKTNNKAYEEAMVPVAKATSALEDTKKMFGIKYVRGEGYVPTKETVSRLSSVSKDKNPELTRISENHKKITGEDFIDEATLTAFKQQFKAGENTRGFARTGLGMGLGMALEPFIPGPQGLVTAAGGAVGRTADYFGGPMASGILRTLGAAKSGVGNVLSALNTRTQGTPYQDIIQNIVRGNPTLLPLLQGNR
jgi:hypothetical protein